MKSMLGFARAIVPVHTPVDGSCDDGNACTTGDTCQNGVCTGTSANACDEVNLESTSGNFRVVVGGDLTIVGCTDFVDATTDLTDDPLTACFAVAFATAPPEPHQASLGPIP